MRYPSPLFLLLFLALPLPAQEPPVVQVDRDDVVLTRSCTLKIVGPIQDRNGNGVVQIAANGITVTFAPGSVLRGAADGVAPDAHTGVGILVRGARDVTLRGLRVERFKVAVKASRADGLVIDGAVLHDNFRQRLGSTPRQEDGSDWLLPHDNDRGEWLQRYGAAVGVDRSVGVTLRKVQVRKGQNGIVLSRVERAKVYDNDCSFLSGWGIAMWRCRDKVVSRNACDYCVRGYSHGVYNRGQDSAGILMFEQCCGNVIADNSATHCGDGLFAYAGHEALGKTKEAATEVSFWRRGNNDNVIVGNDFSYSAAHGIELTFSFGNRILQNRLVGNAICGVWGGYSQDTLISGNLIERNGDAGYGLQRGGINIEHGYRNYIYSNRFAGNACGVHLWLDHDKELLALPWAKVNHRGCLDNAVFDNDFKGDRLVLHLRGARRTVVLRNRRQAPGHDLELSEGSEKPLRVEPPVVPKRVLDLPILGESKPVGARPHLAGRDKIILGMWGPWDHQQPFVRRFRERDRDRFEVFGLAKPPLVSLAGEGVAKRVQKGNPHAITVRATGPKYGIYTYRLTLAAGAHKHTFLGELIKLRWRGHVFGWQLDPRKSQRRFFAAAKRGVPFTANDLDFDYGTGGPRDLALSHAVRSRGPGPDRFGMVVKTRVRLPKGNYKITTTSDDGVRVTVDGRRLIDNWTHHTPTKDYAAFRLDAGREVRIEVAHFELDGYAVLRFRLERL